MFLTVADSHACPCRVKNAFDLHKAGREQTTREFSVIRTMFKSKI